jgi:predicted Zn-dependent protease
MALAGQPSRRRDRGRVRHRGDPRGRGRRQHDRLTPANRMTLQVSIVSVVALARGDVEYQKEPFKIMRNTRTIAVAVLMLLGTLAGGCVSDKSVIAQAADVHNELQPAVMTDPQLASYLQNVGQRIISTAREMDRQGYGPKSHKSESSEWMFGQGMKFHFVNSNTLNAFTTGGEHMYIYTELFEQCKTEDELAAVMAHEYGHVYGRHVAKGTNRQYAALAAAAALGGVGYAAGGKEHGGEYAAYGATAGLAGGQFLNMGFTRKDETEADKLGFAFYTRSGWDPQKFDDFFEQMIAKGYDKTPAIVSDHPTLASRVEDTKRRIGELPPNASQWRQPPVADASEFKRLQARAAELGKKLPNDQSLQNSQKLLQALPRSCILPYPAKDEVEARQQLAQRAETAKKK